MQTPLAKKQFNFIVVTILTLFGIGCFAAGAKEMSALLLTLSLILYHVYDFMGKI